MGMSLHVQGFKAPDARWLVMKEIWEACEKAGISPPHEVLVFFDDEKPDKNGAIVNIIKLDCCKKWNNKYAEGFEITIKDLPKDLTHIRFYMSS
jgi:hypothetical protein